MSFYSHWYEQNVCSRNNNRNNSSGSSSEIYEAINPDLTAAQVTVCSINNRLIYNLEYKVNNYNNNNNKEDLNINNYQQQQQLKSQSKQNIESIANVVTAKFYNHSRNHSRRHSRQTSSNSENLLTIDQLSSDSIWDDWILKYISNNKQISEDVEFTKNSDNLSNIISDDDTIINNGNNNNEDESIEHWIFGKM